MAPALCAFTWTACHRSTTRLTMKIQTIRDLTLEFKASTPSGSCRWPSRADRRMRTSLEYTMQEVLVFAPESPRATVLALKVRRSVPIGWERCAGGFGPSPTYRFHLCPRADPGDGDPHRHGSQSAAASGAGGPAGTVTGRRRRPGAGDGGALTRSMQVLLHDVQALAPGVFLVVVALLLGVGFVASYGPARRAASADPLRCHRAAVCLYACYTGIASQPTP